MGCLVVRVILQAFQMLADDSHIDECSSGQGGVSTFLSTFSVRQIMTTKDLAKKAGSCVVVVLVIGLAWAWYVESWQDITAMLTVDYSLSLIVLKLLIG